MKLSWLKSEVIIFCMKYWETIQSENLIFQGLTIKLIKIDVFPFRNNIMEKQLLNMLTFYKSKRKSYFPNLKHFTKVNTSDK